MILIADSGSTKTHWRLADNDKQQDFFTAGINPFYQTEAEIAESIGRELVPQLNERAAAIDHIHFYGAGCHFPEKKEMVKLSLAKHFAHADIEICNDLLAACRALFANREGIGCILGTGSNSCYYDGNEIKDNVSPLGFIIGDEGSGAVLGKIFVGNILKNQLPASLKQDFLDEYNLTTETILNGVYKKTFPNRFLASFVPFIQKNIDRKELHEMVRSSFDDFFRRNVMQYEQAKHIEIGFVGSIGAIFEETLRESALHFGLKISKITASPMEGLTEFHKL